MEDLALLLGREHVQLEFLLFKLLQLQHLLGSGDPRFLRWSGEEIRRAAQRVEETGLARARAVLTLALAAGLPARRATVPALAEASPEPWKTILLDHEAGCARLQQEIDLATLTAQRLANDAGHAVADVLGELPHAAPPGLLPRQIRLDNPMVLP